MPHLTAHEVFNKIPPNLKKKTFILISQKHLILIQAFDCVPGTLVGESEEKGEADKENFSTFKKWFHILRMLQVEVLET